MTSWSADARALSELAMEKAVTGGAGPRITVQDAYSHFRALDLSERKISMVNGIKVSIITLLVPDSAGKVTDIQNFDPSMRREERERVKALKGRVVDIYGWSKPENKLTFACVAPSKCHVHC